MRLLTGPRGGVSIERRLLPGPGGNIVLEQTFRGDGTRTIVTHAASVRTEIAVTAGRVSFPLASAEVVGPPRFVLSLPPRSVLPIRFSGARVESRGTATFEPVALEAPILVAGPAGPTALDADRAVPVWLRRARRELHELLTHPAPVGIAARRVGVAPETLARGFLRAYRISPKQYCQRARIFEAVLRLLSGVQVAEAGFAAGFSDLGRFYAAFRSLVGATPGVYARVKNRQDRGA